MQTEKLKRVIDLLRSYHGDLQYWQGCGLENWVSCTSGTPTPHYKDLSKLNVAELLQAESFMEEYVADVELMIGDLQNLVEAQS